MGGVSFAQWATIIAYVFIIVAYSWKISKIVRKPIHLRWELYPVLHEEGYKHGGSYYEEMDWWTKTRKKNYFRAAIYLLKNYLFFGEYFTKKRSYWLGLYPWHLGFYLIVGFHILAFFGAVVVVVGHDPVTALSTNAGALFLYYLTLVVAVASFILGIIGSIGMLVKRLADEELKNFAAPINYFNYVFFLIVFVSGLIAWLVYDPTLTEYRHFWAGIITFNYAYVLPAEYAHIVLFALFLIYLPFTRSTHYITKILAFFGVRWDDTPNLKNSKIAKKVGKLLEQRVSWSAPHIQTGKKWSEIAQGLPAGKDEAKAK